MDLDNQTELEASVFRGDLPGEGATLAVVVAKACGVFNSQGHMGLDPSRKLPFRQVNAPHEFGHIPGDIAVRKAGVDVMALGKAYHPTSSGGPQSLVTVRVGDVERSLEVFGDRYWYRQSDGQWAISDPEPFSLMDLTWNNAYGGDSFDEHGNVCMHPLNPDGKGFVVCEEAADDALLPNLEHPDQRITVWDQQPRPINIAPAPKPIAFDLEGEAEALKAVQEGSGRYQVPDELWNDAVPHFRFGEIAPGTLVSLKGMYERPLLALTPSFRLLARVRLSARETVIPLVLDTLLFCPETQHCELTWRGSFKYKFVPRETRIVVLERAPA